MTSQFDFVSDAYEASEELPLREHLEHHSIRTLAGDLTGRGALDIGCGTGVYTRRLAQWGARPVVGMDISEGMLDAARAVEAAAPLGITYLCRDLSAPRSDHQVTRVDLALSVYVLAYSASFDGLVAMCRLARESLATGGRFLAATLNPDYADEAEHPGYYQNLRIALSAHNKGPRRDGTQVTLSMQAIDDTDPITVDTYWWSYDVYHAALTQAGFTHVTWHDMTVSQQGLDTHGRSFWTRYLARPHSRVIEAW